MATTIARLKATMDRQEFLENQGWRVIRFSNEDVLLDVDAVAISLARQLEVDLTVRGKTLD